MRRLLRKLINIGLDVGTKIARYFGGSKLTRMMGLNPDNIEEYLSEFVFYFLVSKNELIHEFPDLEGWISSFPEHVIVFLDPSLHNEIMVPTGGTNGFVCAYSEIFECFRRGEVLPLLYSRNGFSSENLVH